MTRFGCCNFGVCGRNNGHTFASLRVGAHETKSSSVSRGAPRSFPGRGFFESNATLWSIDSFPMESSQKELGGVWRPWWSIVLSRDMADVWTCFCTCSVCYVVTTEQENFPLKGTALPLYSPTFPGMFCSNLPTWMVVSVWGIAVYYLLAVWTSTGISTSSHFLLNCW